MEKCEEKILAGEQDHTLPNTDHTLPSKGEQKDSEEHPVPEVPGTEVSMAGEGSCADERMETEAGGGGVEVRDVKCTGIEKSRRCWL